MKNIIPFNEPYISGLELKNFRSLIKKKNFSARGYYTEECEKILSQKYQSYALLTKSCTNSLEVIAYLMEIKTGDEVIVPSYTFVSTANAFAIRGAKIVFADSNTSNPCIDVNSILKNINKKTKAVCVVHYAGISCDIKEIVKICKLRNIKLIEDCAHSYDAFGYKKRLGTFGDFATLSFHDTKNLMSGEGGALIIKKKTDYLKSKIIIEKGTNRSLHISGKIKKYTWISLGSSYELSEINASFLFAQLQYSKFIKKKRIEIFNFYKKNLKNLAKKKNLELPIVPYYSKINGHIFYIILNNKNILLKLKKFAKERGVMLNEHYECLHKSPFILKYRKEISLPNSQIYADRLLRLPIYPDLSKSKMKFIIKVINMFFFKNK